MSKIVIALGGNALGNTVYEQQKLVKETAKPIADLIEQGNQVIIAHGNGPQVGMINLGLSTAAESGAIKSDMPLPECCAMSQGYIGYHLQNALLNELSSRGIRKEVVTVVTQIIVDENDPAFANPVKPIGSYYSREEALKLEKEKGYIMKNESSKGYRQVVPSPKPVDIIEKNVVKSLVDSGCVVITVGGGGIPVVKKENGYEGIPAIIDKDYASEKLAELTDADMLIILTAVEKVALNYGKPDERWLSELSFEEADRLAEEGQFGAGSMLPKVCASVLFAKSRKGRKSVITSLNRALDAINGKTGTVIYR